MKILIDSREKKPFTFANYEVETAALKTGDYSIKGLEDKLVLERKSISDFTSSITKQRFWNEMERMADISKSYLILEFSIEDAMKFPVGSGIPKKLWRFLRVKPKFILSCLQRIEDEYGVIVIHSASRDEAAKKCLELLLAGV